MVQRRLKGIFSGPTDLIHDLSTTSCTSSVTFTVIYMNVCDMMRFIDEETAESRQGTDFLSLYLLAVDALLSKLLLVARQAEVVALLLHKVAGADGLLAAVAGEAVLVPAVALVLHLFRAWWPKREKRVRPYFYLYNRTLVSGSA